MEVDILKMNVPSMSNVKPGSGNRAKHPRLRDTLFPVRAAFSWRLFRITLENRYECLEKTSLYRAPGMLLMIHEYLESALNTFTWFIRMLHRSYSRSFRTTHTGS